LSTLPPLDRLYEFIKYQASHGEHRGEYNKIMFMGFEVYTAVVMKSSVFWDITSYSPRVSENISPPSSGSKNKPRKFFLLYSVHYWN
jgi:hypothetical protein